MCVCVYVCVWVRVPKPTALKGPLRQENNWKLHGEDWKRLECKGRRLAFEDARRACTRCAAQLYTLTLKKKQDDDRVYLLQVWECLLNLFMLVFCCMLRYAMQAAPTTWVGLVLKGNVKRASRLRRWLTFMRTLKLIDPNLSLSQSNCSEATTKMT